MGTEADLTFESLSHLSLANLSAQQSAEFEDDDGCPDYDNDQDGLLDEVDQCPMEQEDKDGFEDEDGCPEPDNDGDTILDEKDPEGKKLRISKDDTHPNGDGHKLITKVIYDKYKKIYL